MNRLDTNQDGRIEASEVPDRLKPMLDRLDVNQDGAADRDEVTQGLRQIRRQFSDDDPDSPDSPDARTATDNEAGSPSADGSEPQAGLPAAKAEPFRIQKNDLDGRIWRPLDPEKPIVANVLFFVTGDCPVSNTYAPEIERIRQGYKDRNVQCFLVHVDPATSPASARDHAREYQLSDLPILLDNDHALANYAGARVTPEAAVVTAGGTLAYVGRIDDRFGKLGRQKPEPAHRELRDALDALLAGKPVAVARTEAIGCPIDDLK
jgi:hypothetical protein